IYRTIGPPARQELIVTADEGAIIVSAPDPLVCFARSNYLQRQRFLLNPSAGLVMIDWMTSGRRARGERWAFDRYESQTDVIVGDHSIFRDSVLLDPHDGPIDGAMRMGLVDCFATILVAGKPVEYFARLLLQFIASQPAREESLIFAASPIESGVVLRV